MTLLEFFAPPNSNKFSVPYRFTWLVKHRKTERRNVYEGAQWMKVWRLSRTRDYKTIHFSYCFYILRDWAGDFFNGTLNWHLVTLITILTYIFFNIFMKHNLRGSKDKCIKLNSRTLQYYSSVIFSSQRISVKIILHTNAYITLRVSIDEKIVKIPFSSIIAMYVFT